jgi:hypothetical protein
MDPNTPPARILPGKAKDEVCHLRGYGRAPCPFATIGPLPSDQFSVPAEEGRGPNQKGGPALTREHPGYSRKEGSVRAPQPWTTGFAGQDLQLMAQDEYLDLALASACSCRHEAEHAADYQVEDGEQHRGILRERASGREQDFRPLQGGGRPTRDGIGISRSGIGVRVPPVEHQGGTAGLTGRCADHLEIVLRKDITEPGEHVGSCQRGLFKAPEHLEAMHLV